MADRIRPLQHDRADSLSAPFLQHSSPEIKPRLTQRLANRIYGTPNFTLLSGDTGMSIARSVGEILHKTIPPNKGAFANNELKVGVDPHEVTGKDVYIIQSTNGDPNTSLRQQKLISLGAKGAGANRIYAIYSNLPYSRQDRIDQPGAPDSARNVMQEILDAGSHNPRKRRHQSQLKADAALLVVDIHSTKPLEIINKDSHYEYANLDSSFVLAPKVRELIEKHNLDVAVAFPDSGAAKRYGNYAEMFGQGIPPAVVKKVRPVDQLNEVHLADNQEDFRLKVAGKDVIMFDDMIDTGKTIKQAAEEFRKAGAKSVRVVATHGVLSGDALENLNSPFIDETIITDSIPPTPEVLAHPKITIIPIAPLIAEAIARIEHKQSIKDLVKDMSKGFEKSYMRLTKINTYRRRSAKAERNQKGTTSSLV